MPSPLIYYAPGAENLFDSFQRDSSPDKNTSAPLKMEPAPDEKSPGHGSDLLQCIFCYTYIIQEYHKSR